MRIEDVSKNHQSKNFKIRVEPDTAKNPLNNDVAPDVTNEVEIRSKVNKQRQKKKDARKKKAGAAVVDVGMGMQTPESFLPSGGKVPSNINGEQKSVLELAAWCDTVKDFLAQLNANLRSPVINNLLGCYEQTVHSGLASLAPLIKKKKKTSRRSSSRAVNRQSSTFDGFMDYMFSSSSTVASPSLGVQRDSSASWNNVLTNVSGMPELNRGHSLFGPTGISGNANDVPLGLFDVSDQRVDAAVVYIMEMDVKGHGLPAFDANGRLYGFYSSGDDEIRHFTSGPFDSSLAEALRATIPTKTTLAL